jgi:3-phenylpropionate/trans-cinnamate dioxygenase ferredoxin reductase component
MGEMKRIAVVGASLAGLRSVEALRRFGFAGEITLVGVEPYFPPYDRPPLSKEMLRGEWGADKGQLRVGEDLAVELRLGVSATSLNLEAREVTLSDDSAVGFDGLVVATGASPRRLQLTSKFNSGVFELRGYDDCVALREAFEKRPRIVIIGAGFIGCEVAAVCRSLNLDVTVVEALDWPMDRVLGGVVGEWAAGVHRANGVEMRLGVGVVGIEGDATPELVVLADGSELQSDIVVSAVGVAPATEWLDGSGIQVRDGVVLDEFCRAPGFPFVVAAGDVARWYNGMFEREMRVEHWTNAVEQASAAAAALLLPEAELTPFSTVPYVWSDQYALKLQYVGIPGTFHGVIDGSLESDKFVAAFEDEGRLVGAFCVNSPGKMPRLKRMIAAHSTVEALADGLS